MADEWKYRNLPRANGEVAPAYWNSDTKEYEVYEGNVDVVKELASIKQTQSEILTRLDSPIDTKLTGSNVEDGIPVRQTNGAISIHNELGGHPK